MMNNRRAVEVLCRFLSVLVICGLLPIFLSTPVWADRTEKINGLAAVANQVLVRFRFTAPPQLLTQVQSAADADEVRGIGGTGGFVVHSRSKSVASLLREFSARADVVYVEPDYVLYAAETVPNDPSFGQLWGLRNTGQVIGGVAGTPGAAISATLAWDLSTGSRANVVAVVDTGIDYNHPDLAANVWSAPTDFTVTIGGNPILCHQGSHGFNALLNNDNPLDDNNHGTHVSGTIGAVGNNGVGVAGVNWTASIIGCKFLNASGSGSTSGAINAIEFAIQVKQIFGVNANVRVLSNSWGGGGFSQALLDEINKANTNGMLFVAAAGNNGSNNDTLLFYPASYNASNIIAVAATDNRDNIASFSNYGPNSVHLGAPGVNILSTTRNNTYASFNGTSMATPHVSGAAALVLSQASSLTTAQLKSALINNVDPLPSLTGLTITGGRLNVNKAIRSVGSPAPDFGMVANPNSLSIVQGSSGSSTVNTSSINGFSGNIALSASGLPSGASAAFSPASVAAGGASTLTITTATATPPGIYPITITGTSGALVHSVNITLTVGAPDFSLSVSPSSRTIKRGASTTYTLNTSSIDGFSGNIALSASGLPSGASAAFSPASVAAGGASTLTVNTTSSTLRGTYIITITGTSGALSHTKSVTLKVNR